MRSILTDNPAEPRIAAGARDPLSHMTIHRYRVQAVHLGVVGSVDGGTLLEWIHRAAHATAARWSGRCCVAASVSNFHLDRPIRVGELVEVHACLVYTRRSSMHILVTVYSGDPAGAQFGSIRPVPNRSRRCRRHRRTGCGTAVVTGHHAGTTARASGAGPDTDAKADRGRRRSRGIHNRGHRPSHHTTYSRVPHRCAQRRRSPRRSSHAVDRRSGEHLCRFLVRSSRPDVLRRCDPLPQGRRCRGPVGGVGANRPHRTAQYPHRCPRDNARRSHRCCPYRGGGSGRRRNTRRARQGPACSAVGAGL